MDADIYMPTSIPTLIWILTFTIIPTFDKSRVTPLRSFNTVCNICIRLTFLRRKEASSQRTKTSSIYKLATFSECVNFALKYSGFGNEN